MATPSTQSQYKTYEVNKCYNTGDCQQMRVKSANSRLCSICYTLSQEILDSNFVQLLDIHKYFRVQAMFIHDV